MKQGLLLICWNSSRFKFNLMHKLQWYIADVYALPKAQQQEFCLDKAPTLLDVVWQGTKCFKTIRKRDKPDSNCSCACGALGKLQTKTAFMVNWWFGAPVFWNPIGFHLSARDFLVGGPIPKMPKPLSHIHRSKKKNRLIRINKGTTTGRPTTVGHIRDPQLQVASIVTRCSLGHFEAPKSTPQVGSGAKPHFSSYQYHWFAKFCGVNHNQNTMLQKSWYSQPEHHMIFGHILENWHTFPLGWSSYYRQL